MSPAWPWVAVALLGAYHGLNPAMGWVFALALGLQEKRRSAAIEALLPIALGHAVSIAIAIIFLSLLQHAFHTHSLRWPIAAIIFALGTYRLFRARHPRSAGMRVGRRDLFVWSFLMASAHGAGLMLVPVLLAHSMADMNYGTASIHNAIVPLDVRTILLSVLVHTTTMLIVAAILALSFFELYNKVGLKILRHAWFNFDLLWAFALLVAAGALLVQ
jgi:hypothetical protein